MAAPNGTVWGAIAGGYGRIGIHVKLTSTNTVTTRVVTLWFWSKYSVDDSSNTLYWNNQATTATTSKGSVDINTTVASGDGWSTSNQVKLAEYTWEVERGTSAKTYNCAAKLTNVDKVGATMTVTTSYTIPALPSYKVTYNANGGSGAPSAQTKYYGKALTLSSTTPTRSGYTFVGWGTSASDTSWTYKAGGTYSGNSAITLYALWKKTITLSYNANGGSGAPSSQSYTVWNATTNHKFTIPSTKPTRTGYTFLGWSTSSTATSATYSPGGTITLSANDTLYAVWTPNVLTVNYYSNYATYCELDVAVSAGTNVKVFTGTLKYDAHSEYGLANYSGSGGSVHMKKDGHNPTKNWNTAANGSGYSLHEDTAGNGQEIASALGKNLASGSVTVNVYAQWTPYKHTVAYDANGGNNAPGSQTKTYGSTITLSSSKPTRTGYTFKCWNTAKDGTGTSYNPGQTYGYDQNGGTVTLYAIWTIDSHKLTVKPNGGTWNGSTDNQPFTQNYNTTKSIPVPTWTGHTFSGWLLSGGGSIASTGAVATTYTFGTSDGALTARWDTNDHVVTFDARTNDGWYGDPNDFIGKIAHVYEYGTTLGELPTATRKNYIFLGWFTAPTGGTKVTSSYKVTGDVTLYAQFEIDASAWVNDEATWEEGVVYTNVGGTMKKSHAKVKDNGIWKDGICK